MSGNHWSSAGINVVTYGIPFWSVSHVGVLAEYQGQTLLFESVYDDPLPCLIQGACFNGVVAHDPHAVIENYNGKVWHYPLYRDLYEHENRRLTDFLISKIGTPYDSRGATRSGGKGYALMWAYFNGEDLSQLFCSETVASSHSHIGIFPTQSSSSWSPNAFVRQERRMGILKAPKRKK